MFNSTPLQPVMRRWRARLKIGIAVFNWAIQAALEERSLDQAEPRLPTNAYGGQAVIEGVMMRGQYVAAIAVRNPKGGIVTKEVPLNAAQTPRPKL